VLVAMNAPLRDKDLLARSRAASGMERLAKLVALRGEVEAAIIAEVDWLASRAGISFRAIGAVLGEPAWVTAQTYQQRHPATSEDGS
jgi:hypothetical protein